jgi:hypothetical protein
MLLFAPRELKQLINNNNIIIKKLNLLEMGNEAATHKTGARKM